MWYELNQIIRYLPCIISFDIKAELQMMLFIQAGKPLTYGIPNFDTRDNQMS